MRSAGLGQGGGGTGGQRGDVFSLVVLWWSRAVPSGAPAVLCGDGLRQPDHRHRAQVGRGRHDQHAIIVGRDHRLALGPADQVAGPLGAPAPLCGDGCASRTTVTPWRRLVVDGMISTQSSGVTTGSPLGPAIRSRRGSVPALPGLGEAESALLAVNARVTRSARCAGVRREPGGRQVGAIHGVGGEQEASGSPAASRCVPPRTDLRGGVPGCSARTACPRSRRGSCLRPRSARGRSWTGRSGRRRPGCRRPASGCPARTQAGGQRVLERPGAAQFVAVDQRAQHHALARHAGIEVPHPGCPYCRRARTTGPDRRAGRDADWARRRWT